METKTKIGKLKDLANKGGWKRELHAVLQEMDDNRVVNSDQVSMNNASCDLLETELEALSVTVGSHYKHQLDLTRFCVQTLEVRINKLSDTVRIKNIEVNNKTRLLMALVTFNLFLTAGVIIWSM